jgi:hypothetical protein
MSLNTLSVELSEAGRRQEAEAAQKEAAEIERRCESAGQSD